MELLFILEIDGKKKLIGNMKKYIEAKNIDVFYGDFKA